MKRWIFLLYGVACHLLFLVTYAYMAGFVGNWFVPKSIDQPAGEPVGIAIAVDLLLLGLFAVQHSVMARPGFKEIWTRLVPRPIERSTYVFVSCAVTALVMWQWRAIDVVIWDFQEGLGRSVLIWLFIAGWLMVPAVTLMINHFDLFGTRQVWLHFQRREYTPLPFRTPMLYSRVRHPLYLGWALAFWATPTMTAGHLLFAGVLTAYMAIAAVVEERDLVSHFGHHYEAYRKHVPMFVPSLKASVRSQSKPAVKEQAVAP
jgi:protein-S-isoprenylcysteine O-methyltransferase Ste14